MTYVVPEQNYFYMFKLYLLFGLRIIVSSYDSEMFNIKRRKLM